MFKQFDTILLLAKEAPLGLIYNALYNRYESGDLFKDDIINPKIIPYHLCVISKERIQIGDWYYNSANKRQPINTFPKVIDKCSSEHEAIACNDTKLKPCYKIIATTLSSKIIMSPNIGWITNTFLDVYCNYYNKGKALLKVNVLMEAIPTEWDNPLTNPEGIDTIDSIYQPKLNKEGYVFISYDKLSLLPNYI